MTVSYAGEVPNGSSFGCFWKILWKWRGSVYKLVWRELIAYLCLYYTINLLYRFVFTKDQQVLFNRLREYFGKQSETIPMSFVLGFYVTLIVKRWWEQYRLLPWPDTLALFISAAIPNTNGGVNNETGRLMRRNIMRYMVLSYVITLQRISLRVKRRFPTTQHLVDAGLMHESEMKIFEALNQKSPMSKYWMPLVWATNIINRARKEGLIISDHIVQTILMELSDIRRRLGGLIGYDTVCVPLVYTQVVTLVLYTYFIAALLGRQMLPNMVDTSKSELDTDLYFPLFLVLQFAFYVGWLKVAEVLINPFGEDDDDIELNWLIDRHIKAAYMIVDEMHEEHPELLRDQYWECVVPANLPYTVASEHYRRAEPKGSAEKFKVKKEDAMYANIMPGKRMNDDVYADYESVDTPMVERRKNNWLVRQLSRMGSVRSQSTAYSSSGLAFNRNRLNSVYSSPESGMPLSIMQQQHLQQQQQQQQQQLNQTNMQSKPSLYEKFVHRKSIRAHKQLIKQNSRINGLNVNGPKTRPRIPTPDVNKEPGERDSNGKLIIAPLTTATTSAPTISSTTTNKPNAPPPPNALLMSKKAPMQYPQFNANAPATPPTSSGVGGGAQDRVFGTLLLSPIKEMDNSSSSNNTLIAGHPATTALAQTVLPPNVTDMSFGVATQMPVTTSITTLSFPFTVNTSSADTIPTGSTLNIVPLQANQMPTITTTTSNGYDGKDVITTIPVSLSIQRSPSALTITELAGNGDDQHLVSDATATTTTTTALLSIKPVGNGGGGVQRTGSFNANLGLTLQEPFVMERNTSIRSAGQAEAGGSNQAELAPTSSSLGVTSTAQSSSSSAPSTLAKQKPEERTGEVYV